MTGPNQQLSQVFQYENLRRRAVPLTVTVTQTGVGSAQAGASTAVVNQVRPLSAVRQKIFIFSYFSILDYLIT